MFSILIFKKKIILRKIVRYCHPDKQDTHANDRIKLEAMKVINELTYYL